MNQSIQQYHLDTECQLFRQNRQQFQQTQKQLQQTLDIGTQKERKDVETAIQKLNQKTQMIMKTNQFQQQKKELDQLSNRINLSLDRAYTVFKEARKQILEDNSLGQQQKARKIQLLSDKIGEKLFSPQEIQAFKKMVFVMLPPQSLSIKPL